MAKSASFSFQAIMIKTLGWITLIASVCAVLSLMQSWFNGGLDGFLDDLVKAYRSLFHGLIIDPILSLLSNIIDISVPESVKDVLIIYSIGLSAWRHLMLSIEVPIGYTNLLDRRNVLKLISQLLWPISIWLALLFKDYLIDSKTFGRKITEEDIEFYQREANKVMGFAQRILAIAFGCIVAVLINEAYGLL